MEWRSFAVGVVAGEVPGVIGVGEVVCRDRRGVVKFASDFDLALGHWRGEGELTGGEGGAAVPAQLNSGEGERMAEAGAREKGSLGWPFYRRLREGEGRDWRAPAR